MTIPTEENNYEHWPLNDIKVPGHHDVMCGRGGGTNNHPGNIKFRQLVNQHKLRYIAATKVDKPKVARDVVHIWRAQEPPGRFLTKSSATTASKSKEKIWHDVGDQKAREKASQCLRERTPDVMPIVKQLQHQKVLEKQQNEKNSKTATYNSKDEKERENVHLQQYRDYQGNLHQHIDNGVNQDLSTLVNNPEAAAAALLDPRTSDGVATVLRKLSSLGTSGDDDSINEEASVRAIARSFGFADQPLKHDDKLRQPSNLRSEYNNIPKTEKLSANKTDSMDDLIKSMLQEEDFDRLEKMDNMSKCSWLRSFQSIDTISMESMSDENSLGKISNDEIHNNGRSSRKQMMEQPSRKQKMEQMDAFGNCSKMSIISELTNYDETMLESKRSLLSRARKMEKAKGLQSNRSDYEAMLDSKRSILSRARKMESAKGNQSNISMFSELTDMTGDFSNLNL